MNAMQQFAAVLCVKIGSRPYRRLLAGLNTQIYKMRIREMVCHSHRHPSGSVELLLASAGTVRITFLRRLQVAVSLLLLTAGIAFSQTQYDWAGIQAAASRATIP